MIVIGITGSIGMGKTTVADMIRELAIPVHDSDATVHFLLGPDGEAVETIATLFPDTVDTNEEGKRFIDREKLSRIVLMDREKKNQLEGILHPMVKTSADAFAAEMKAKGHQMVGLDIPLLFETGRDKDVDVTICVSAPKEIQKERVLGRPNMIEAKFDAIAAGQMTDEQKRLRSDHVIDSGQSMEDMREQVVQVIKKIEIQKLGTTGQVGTVGTGLA